MGVEQKCEVRTPFWAAIVEVFTIMKKTWTIMDATAGNTRIALNVTVHAVIFQAGMRKLRACHVALSNVQLRTPQERQASQ